MPPEERRRYYQEVVSSIAQGAKPVGGLTTKFDAYPGLEQFTVEIDNYAVVDGKYLYFDLPFTPSLFPPGPDRRTLPLFLSGGSDSTIRAEVDLPPGFRQVVIAPKSEALKAPNGGGKARVSTKNQAGKCIITCDLQTAPAIIKPKDYPSVVKVQAALAQKSARVFLLERSM